MNILTFLMSSILFSLLFSSSEASFHLQFKRPSQQLPSQQQHHDQGEKYQDYEKFLYTKRQIDTFETYED